MMTQLSRRKLSLRLMLGQGAYATGADTVTLDGLRVSCTIAKSGGVGMSTLDLRAFGMPLAVMNRLSILGAPLLSQAPNQIDVLADGSLCYSGVIREAWIDANNSPEVSFAIAAVTGGLDKLKPANASSYQGSADAATILTDMASRLSPPKPLVNNGVSVKLSNPYHAGTLYDQMQEVARAGDFEIIFDDNEVAIWPRDAARDSNTTIVSADTGMVGYPAHTQNGISVQMLYNPSIRYGSLIQVKSILAPATGLWKPFQVTHDLESETHGGKWFTSVECSSSIRPLALAT